jgi:sirohydrochlorin ferrochelatase
MFNNSPQANPLMDNPEHCSADFASQGIGVLLVGHGTRSVEGQAQMVSLFQTFKQLLCHVPCELAFLELAKPLIPAAVSRLARVHQVRQLITVPVILFSAGHAEQDIPGAVQAAAEQHSVQVVGQTATLDCTPEVLQLSAERFRQAMHCTACLNSGRCQGQFCPQISWLLIGRGSSSPTATEMTRQFTQLRQQLTPTRTARTAFIHGQSPSVPEAFQLCGQDDCSLVVVQPHLIFSGLLLEQLQQQVADQQRKNPHQRWILTETLGADRRLAELLAQRAKLLLQSCSSQ